ncbi:alpha/beta hydrolase [Rhodococcus opacus]|uniref:alpha/beta hydrolase n=1 Tax=Rhodococcus opacus TaxID=37919 RepID=UPI001C46AEF4|nr:alpha/beta hydrolase [Rhodococcus opacus]MBV6760441.1 alpha/beta hydrolase [Rhodococcus opacus]
MPTYDEVVGTYHAGCFPLPPATALRGGAVTSYFGVRVTQPDGFRAVTIDLHVPAAATRPVRPIIFASGGGFRINSPIAGPWIHLVEDGFAVACVTYRLSSEAPHPAPVADVKAVVRWLRAHGDQLGIDADKVGAFGMSAGGYLVCFAASNPQHGEHDEALPCHLELSSELNAVAAYFPPSDYLELVEDNGGDAVEVPGVPGASEVRYLGYVPRDAPDRNRESSLIEAVGAGTPLHFLAHGTADRRVNIKQSDRLAEALRRHGRLVDYVRIDGADHGGPEFFERQLSQKVADFLTDALQ